MKVFIFLCTENDQKNKKKMFRILRCGDGRCPRQFWCGHWQASCTPWPPHWASIHSRTRWATDSHTCPRDYQSCALSNIGICPFPPWWSRRTTVWSPCLPGCACRWANSCRSHAASWSTRALAEWDWAGPPWADSWSWSWTAWSASSPLCILSCRTRRPRPCSRPFSICTRCVSWPLSRFVPSKSFALSCP